MVLFNSLQILIVILRVHHQFVVNLQSDLSISESIAFYQGNIEKVLDKTQEVGEEIAGDENKLDTQ